MYSSQLNRALQKDPAVSVYFDGVFPSDKLPVELINYPAALVANVDPARKPGSHWIAYHFGSDKHLDYFDSYGRQPNAYSDNLSQFAADNSSTISYSSTPVQGLKSDVCGHYCLMFLALRARGYSYKDIIDHYSSNGNAKPGEYDKVVVRDVHKLFGKLTRYSKQSGRGGVVTLYGEQCCCTKDYCYRCLWDGGI